MIPFKYIFHALIVPGSILIPIILFITRYKNAKPEAKVLFYFLITSSLINISAIIISRFHKTNLPLLHLFTIVEAIFLLLYFRLILKGHLIKKIIFYLIVIFPILCILNFSFLQSIYSFNTYTRPLEAILITFLCLMYLYKSDLTAHWLQQPNNWFNLGILIYFPVAFVIFVSSNYFTSGTNSAMKTMVWNLHAALVLLMYLAWAKGFSLIKKDG